MTLIKKQMLILIIQIKYNYQFLHIFEPSPQFEFNQEDESSSQCKVFYTMSAAPPATSIRCKSIDFQEASGNHGISKLSEKYEHMSSEEYDNRKTQKYRNNLQAQKNVQAQKKRQHL